MLHLVLHPLWQALLVFFPVAVFIAIGWPAAGVLLRGGLVGLVGTSCLWVAELVAQLIVGTTFDPSAGLVALVSLSVGSILAGMAVDRFGMTPG